MVPGNMMLLFSVREIIMRIGKIKAMSPQVKLSNQATHSVIPEANGIAWLQGHLHAGYEPLLNLETAVDRYKDIQSD